MRWPVSPACAFPEQVHDERRVEMGHSLGARAGERRREAMVASVASRVDGSSATRSSTDRSVAPVAPVRKRSLMTSENDWLGRFRRRSASYASRSMVMVFTAMHQKCTWHAL